MAFRRRRRFGGRFSRPVARVNRYWDTTLFTSASQLDITGADATWLVLATGQTSGYELNQLDTAVAKTKYIKVKRIVFRGHIVLNVLSTAFQFQTGQIVSALITQDQDDSDGDLTSTSTSDGNVLGGQADRLLWTNSYGFGVKESTGTTMQEPRCDLGFPIDIDVRPRGLRFMWDQWLLLGFQLQASLASTINSIALTGISRVLIELG